MKKLLIILMLALASASAMAEWTPVAWNDEIGLTVYADFATIRKAGNKVKMWAMYDYKTAQEIGLYKYLSTKDLWEFHCQEEEFRVLYAIYFSGNMGNGDSVARGGEPTKFIPILPGTCVEFYWKIACKQKK